MKILFVVFLLLVSAMVFAEGENINLTFTGKMPFAIFYKGEDISGTLSMNKTNEDNFGQAKLSFSFTDGFNNPIDVKVPDIVLSDENNWKSEIKLPEVNGYVKVKADCEFLRISPPQIQGTKEFSFSYAIVPNNYQDFKDVDSPFGICVGFNQAPALNDEMIVVGNVLKRLGIEYMRGGEPSLNDISIEVAKANKLCYMPVFTDMGKPTWDYFEKLKAEGVTKVDKWDFTPYIKDYGEYAKKYGDYIDYYDLCNEVGNSGFRVLWSFYKGNASSVYFRWQEQIARLIKKYDKDAKTVWEDAGMFPQTRQAILDNVDPDTIDAISPHPYSLDRNCPYPEDMFILEDYSLIREFCRNHNFKQLPVIVGEIGFSSFNKDKYNEPGLYLYTAMDEYEQARLLVRALVLHYAMGAEKIFYYQVGDGPDKAYCEHNFGILADVPQPKPSAVSYANLIHRVRGCEWMGRYYKLDGTFGFAYKKGSKAGLILWTKGNTRMYWVDGVKTPMEEIHLYDMYGNELPKPNKDENNTVWVPIGPDPVYLEGINVEDIQGLCLTDK